MNRVWKTRQFNLHRLVGCLRCSMTNNVIIFYSQYLYYSVSLQNNCDGVFT